MTSSATRALAMIGAATLAVTGTMLATAAPAHAAEDLEWDLRTPVMDQRSDYGAWESILTNSTDNAVKDVTVRFSISVPEGEQSPVHIEVDDPSGDGNDSACELNGDAQSVSCETDLATQESSFSIYLVRDREVDLGNGAVGLHAEVARGDTKLASADDEMKIEHNSSLDRVKFQDVPEEVPTDRTRPNGVAWSFTVTNDSSEPVSDGVIDIELSSAAPPGLELGTDHELCNADSKTLVTCGEFSALDPGESLKVDMKLFADGTTEDLADKVTLSVDMTASTEEEPIDFAYGETHTRAVIADKSDNDILPVTGSSLGGYLGAGAGIILLGAGMLLLTRRRVAATREV